MSENNGTKILLAFIAGAAIGITVGYLLNSDKKDELVSDLKEGAESLKKGVNESLSKAKEIIDEFKGKDTEPETKS